MKEHQYEYLSITTYTRIYSKKLMTSKGWRVESDKREDNRRGKNNKRYDPTIYFFRNILSGQIVSSTQNEFKKNYFPGSSNISGLVSGKHKFIKGWEIIK